jgi:hypothetical protein
VVTEQDYLTTHGQVDASLIRPVTDYVAEAIGLRNALFLDVVEDGFEASRLLWISLIIAFTRALFRTCSEKQEPQIARKEAIEEVGRQNHPISLTSISKRVKELGFAAKIRVRKPHPGLHSAAHFVG